jgi:acetate kinase
MGQRLAGVLIELIHVVAAVGSNGSVGWPVHPVWQGGRVHILVVNAGSSSMKLCVLDDDDAVVASKDWSSPGPQDLGGLLGEFLDEAPLVDAVGHRVVHGGSAFTRPILLNEGIDEALTALTDLAPLHNPPCLAAIRAMHSLRPEMPQIACFDTSFHTDMPAKAATYALPRWWRDR